MNRFALPAVGVVLMLAGELAAVSIKSGDELVEGFIVADGRGQLYQRVMRDGKLMLDNSRIGLIVDGVDLGTQVQKVELGEVLGHNKRYPWKGAHAEARDQYREASVILHRAGPADQNIEMVIRTYDDGFAYRFKIPGSGRRHVTGESSSWVLPKGCICWHQNNIVNYEGEITRLPIEQVSGKLGGPILFRLPGDERFGKGWVAITESVVDRYSGMTFSATSGACVFKAGFEDDPKGFAVEGGSFTPWRVTMVGPDLTTMVNSTLVPNLAPPAPEELAKADWIKPGRAVWSWWAHDTRLEDQKPYINAAVQLGFEYTLWDEGWEKWGEEKIDDLLEYAKQHQVKVWLWKRVKDLFKPEAREKFFDYIDGKNKQHGEKIIVGAKIDFFDSESVEMMGHYRAMLDASAKHQLMVNFHGANKPCGEARTWPHEMTREGVRGLEYNKFSKGLPPFHNAGLPFTRYLAGAGDYTPVTFDPAKLRGTTFAHQLATAFVFTSPIIHFADDPRRLLESPAVEVIKATPAVWDLTTVLPQSDPGRLAAMVRRSGERWFIAALSGDDHSPTTLTVPLAFLGDATCDATVVEDAEGDAPGLKVTHVEMTSKGTFETTLRPAGGVVVMLVPRPAAQTGPAK